MTPERWRRVNEIFLAAVSQPDAMRNRYLSQVCEGDDDLRANVEILISHDATAAGFLAPPSGNVCKLLGTASIGQSEKTGVQIDGYEILSELGRGGQGVVYQAVQIGTKRDVAIKVLLGGAYASELARKRFQREFEVVAQLKHPNIVAVFHAGDTEDGQSFAVMDFVRGRPLNCFVRDGHLPMEDTLRLFATVSDAVDYAHRKGVIHRDLKPSNILVDEDGTPMILDFGLAKQTAPTSGSQISFSRQVVGTLPYMSPEQTRGDAAGIDSLTDVYSLGVILYELTTGCFPYPVEAKWADVLKHITDTPPARPSRKWTPESGIVRRKRRGLRSRACPIDSELETIVLKPLAKEPERRYQTAGELARDLRHYLAGEPIVAKRDSGWYVARKTIKRHRIALAVAAVLVLTLSTSAYVQVGRIRADREAARQLARAQLNEARLDVHSDPAKAQATLEKLDLLEAKIELVQLYMRESQRERAVAVATNILERHPNYGRAHSLLAELYRHHDPKRAAHHEARAQALSARDEQTRDSDYFRAIALPRADRNEKIRILTKILDRDPRDFDARRSRANLAQEVGNYEMLAADADHLLADRPNLPSILELRAVAAMGLGHLDEAVDYFTLAIEAKPKRWLTLYNRGVLYQQLERWPQALADCDRALELKPDDAKCHVLRAWVLHGQERHDDALVECGRALELDARDASAHVCRGSALSALGRVDEAMAAFDRGLELDPEFGRAYFQRGKLHHRARHYREAVRDYSRALEHEGEIASWYSLRGQAYMGLLKFGRAASNFTRAIELDPDLAEAHHNRGRVGVITGDYQAALADHRTAVELDSANPERYMGRGIAYWATGDLDSALDDFKRIVSRDSRRFVLVHLWIWQIQMSRGQADAAADALAAARTAGASRLELEVILLFARETTPVQFADNDRLAERGDLYYYLGAHALSRGRTSEAGDWFRRCLESRRVEPAEYDLARVQLRLLSPS